MKVRKTHLLIAFTAFVISMAFYQPVFASPFGLGVFGADVPYGSATSIVISLSGSVGLVMAPSGPNFAGSGSHTVTVTSTDVVGYKLYANSSTTTSLSNGNDTIAASSNNSPAPLAVNSWGYNTTGSPTNFKGMTLSPVLLKAGDGPFKNGDDTTVTYGALIDHTKSAGTYSANVTYTAVGDS